MKRREVIICGLISLLLAYGPVLAQFTPITEGVLVTDVHNSWGFAVGDFDDDGYPDIYMANGIDDPDVLYRNTGSLTGFEKTLLQDNRLTPTAAWADWDNNGELDLFVPAYSQHGAELYSASYLMAVVQGEADFPPPHSFPHSGFDGCSAWADFDLDGYVDLYVGSYRVDPVPYYSVLFHNQAGELMVPVESEITAEASNVNGCGWADYDNDGDLDLFIANSHGGDNLFFRNDWPDVWTKITEGGPGPHRGSSLGSDWGDYDNDGDLDLFVANGSNQDDFLYCNEGNGTFVRVQDSPVVSSGGTSFSAAWGDYDNDGDLDLFVANNWRQADFLFENEGNGTFVRVNEGAWVNNIASGVACAWVDLDNDGDLDLLIGNGDEDGTPEPNFLYRNDGNGNGWILIRLVGTVSNRSGIGAKVRVRSQIGGREVWQTRQVSSGGDFAQKDHRVHFGLGDASSIDTLRIEWPSGIVQELSNLSPRQIITVTEPPRLIPREQGAFQIRCWINQGFQVQASDDMETWTNVDTITNHTGTSIFHDTDVSAHRSRYYRVRGPCDPRGC